MGPHGASTARFGIEQTNESQRNRIQIRRPVVARTLPLRLVSQSTKSRRVNCFISTRTHLTVYGDCIELCELLLLSIFDPEPSQLRFRSHLGVRVEALMLQEVSTTAAARARNGRPGETNRTEWVLYNQHARSTIDRFLFGVVWGVKTMRRTIHKTLNLYRYSNDVGRLYSTHCIQSCTEEKNLAARSNVNFILFMNCVFMIRFILKVQAIFCKKKSFKFLRPLQNPNEAFFGPKIMIVFIFHQLV